MFDSVLAFVRVISSSVEGDDSYTLYNVTGTAALDGDDSDEAGENALEQEAYQALGRVARPMPKDDEGLTEAIATRTEDGLIPFGFRDARLHRAFPNPKEGTIADVHYGGGFQSMDYNGNGNTTHTIYGPKKDLSSAHAFIMDPDEGISIVEQNGYLIYMSENGILLQAKAGGAGGGGSTDTAIEIKQGTITIAAPNIVMQGTVAIGDPALGIPLLPGVASPPCSTLYVSP